jgi:methyltransferase
VVTSQLAYFALLLLVGAERLYELRLSKRNADLAFARGGVEMGREHFGWMRVLHAGFLLACALEVAWFHRSFDPRVGLPMLALALSAQALRYWAIASLGPRWNVRVIVMPGEPVVTDGPYRWVRHPNYAAVVLEGVAIPLIHGAWLTALVFSALNALLLRVRIQVEERALSQHCELEARLGHRPRLVPLRSSR